MSLMHLNWTSKALKTAFLTLTQDMTKSKISQLNENEKQSLTNEMFLYFQYSILSNKVVNF